MNKRKIYIIKDIGISILILISATLIGLLFRHWEFHETNIVVIYIFSVLLISRFTKGYVYGIVSSVISLLLFNWFFTEPYYTFKVDDMTYLFTFAIIIFTSILTSTLTTKVKKAAIDAKEKENESNALYQMTSHLTDADGKEDVARITAKTTSDVLNCNTGFICYDENGVPENTFIASKQDGIIIRRKLNNVEELQKRMSNLHDDVDITDEFYLYPVYGKNNILAVLSIPNKVGANMTASQTRMIHSIIENAALALDRLRSFEAQVKSLEETAKERYRANLLRAISHDIRTPLSGIMGTSEMIISKSKEDDACYSLAKDIYKDAEWLHGLVENILNLTKLQDDTLKLEKTPEAVEEVIGAALMVMEKRMPDRCVDINMPDNVVMVPMDAKLITQVLVNLLDNAYKYTEKNCKITISVIEQKDKVKIIVKDEGQGIPKSDLPHIFKMFYTSKKKSADSKRGVGLGLAICQSIIEAHGGSISAKNNDDKGASFIFTLPIGGDTNDN